MLAFTNNSGPLFVIGTVGILLFGNSTIGILLFVTHILSSITVGFILGISSKLYKSSKKKLPLSTSKQDKLSASLSNLGHILATSIYNSISTIILIGGFVIIFSVILSILNNLNIISIFSNLLSQFSIPHDFSKSLISGIIELTNGVSLASAIHTKTLSNNIILCAFLLGFGGFSVLLQVLSIISKAKLSIRIYVLGKLLQGLISALYTLLLIKNISIFNIDISTQSGFYQNNFVVSLPLIIFLLIPCIFLIFYNQKKLCYS